MCGIAGLLVKGNLDKSVLLKMTDTLFHRGPDNAGCYFRNYESSTLGFGHCRLKIIDLSENANQPMHSKCGRYTMVYNGEVYNYKEVKEKILNDFELTTNSDTEVVLESFAKIGMQAADYWNGMFAAAIWDNEKHELTLIRDRVGKKPIYYYWDGKDFIFASELKAIKSMGLHLTINKQAIANYLNIGYIPHPETIYNEVYKVEAGTCLVLSKNVLKKHVYWSIESKVKSQLITNEQEAKAELKRLLISSVELRMISDVQFGTFLSGGVDSSLITAIAQSISSVPVKTFSIAFGESSFDESLYAQKVADHLKTEHHALRLTEQDGINLINDITQVYDEPFADVSAVPTMLVSQFARKDITMALSGDGGDELFLGYGMYDWAERMDRPLLWHTRKLISSVLKLGNKRYKRASWVFDADSKKGIQQHIFSQEQGFFSSAEIEKYFYTGKPAELFTNSQSQLNAAEKQALFDFKYYLPDDLLVKIDRASMRYSLEVRAPLLDFRLVEFAYSLHPNLKKKGVTAKYLLKEVLYDYLPKDIFNRPKWGFAFPLEVLLKKELRYLLDLYLDTDLVKEIGLCDPQYINQLKNKYLNGETHVYYKLWTVIQLHKWYKENIL
jgi:asparagine synthase (glutamine-hydrolysing)